MRITILSLFVFLSTSLWATSFTNETTFRDALTGGFTEVDGQGFSQISQLSFVGGSFFGPNAVIRSDGLIENGQGFHGAANPHVGMNFDSDVFGVGVTSNPADGGRVLGFSGLNGTGNLVEQANFGSPALFGGFVSTEAIRSVIFTCDFNGDLKCGLFRPTFGTVLNEASVPEPGTYLLIALSGIFFSFVSRKN